MDDINAKRNARRRRILENSERRLLKITDRNPCAEAEGPSIRTTETTTDLRSTDFEHNINDARNDRTYNDNIGKSDDPLNGVPSLSTYTRGDGNNDDEDIFRVLSGDINFANLRAHRDEAYECRYDENKTTGSNTKPSVHTQRLPYVLLSSRMNYVLLALIVNVLLIFRLDGYFGKTIAIPYLTMLLGRLYTSKNMQLTQGYSLLFTALILCNIRPGLTYKFKRLLTVLNIIFGDLAVYIFSFTLIYGGLSYCLSDKNIPIALSP